ncbi:hypothetical protein Pint_31010 [Pistacia integerrima]|uniref:Uncharacterized protein n=1 Tax=Pistacia integerrima TaxID=434235 RepID=A0ACC0XPN8_9ROSI|nr:hypothetical protein Pint_31010 [Pistacia integerrima]
MGLPWCRVHTILSNDHGRLLFVHIIHTTLVAGWTGSMVLYELVIFYYIYKMNNLYKVNFKTVISNIDIQI